MNKALLPPGPRHPAAIQGAWLSYRPFGFLEWCRIGTVRRFTVKIPALGRVPILPGHKTSSGYLRAGRRLRQRWGRRAPLVDFAGDRSLMKLDGVCHRDHREVLGQASSHLTLPDGGERLLERIREAVATWPLGRRFDLGTALDELALLLVSELALGEAAEELIVAASKTLEGLRRAARPIGLLRKALAATDQSGFRRAAGCRRTLPRSKAQRRRASKPRAQVVCLCPHGGCVVVARDSARWR